MRLFLAERLRPVETPVAPDVRRAAHASVALEAGNADRHRDVGTSLLDRSGLAIAQVFAVSAKVSDIKVSAMMEKDLCSKAPNHGDAVPGRAPRCEDRLADGIGDRFSIDDARPMRRDGIEIMPSCRTDIPRAAGIVLRDLALSDVPVGRRGFFTAKPPDEPGPALQRNP